MLRKNNKKIKIFLITIFSVVLSLIFAGTILACTPSNGDLNHDQKIDLADFEILRREFDMENVILLADLDCDGKVTIKDFELWRQFFINTIDTQERCEKYSSSKDCGETSYTYCATCGDGICEMPQEGCMGPSWCEKLNPEEPYDPDEPGGCACTNDCGPLMCPEDCDGPSPTIVQSIPTIIHIGKFHNDKTVELQKGQKLMLSLEANPSTGFQWEIVEIDTAILKQIGDAKCVPYNDMAGSPCTLTYEFEAMQDGKTELKLIYYRSFEEGVPPAKTFNVTVVVSDGSITFKISRSQSVGGPLDVTISGIELPLDKEEACLVAKEANKISGCMPQEHLCSEKEIIIDHQHIHKYFIKRDINDGHWQIGWELIGAPYADGCVWIINENDLTMECPCIG